MLTLVRATVIFLALCCHTSYAASQSIALANGEWPPLLGETLPSYGYGSQIVSRAFALKQVRVTYHFYPWKRSLEEARTGRVAGTLLWSSNADRQKDFLISQPVYRSKTMLFFNRNRPIHWQQLSDLKGKYVGVTNGYSYGETWNTLISNRTLFADQANTDVQNFAKLLANRIDAFPCEEIIGMHIIRSQLGAEALQQINISPKPVHDEPMHLLISRRHPNAEQLMRHFNAGLAQMKRNGELDAILKKAFQR
jgi:polar amino acid transport system substrate-binding protein